ncbi:mitofusin [Lecanora helva]
MSPRDYPDDDDPDSCISSESSSYSAPQPSHLRIPNYMTVGSGSTSASAAALMSTLDHDSGYGTNITDDEHGNDGNLKGWHPGLTGDLPTPAHTPTLRGETNLAAENERRVVASHVHQLYYNQNRAALGRQITRTVDLLRKLQEENAKWPAQYPTVQEPQNQRSEPRPGFAHTQSSSGNSFQRRVDNVPLRPGAPRRAATSIDESSDAESSSSAQTARSQEPERLVTPQSAQDFSVLKLNMNVQGFTQAEIASSVKKESIASLLDGKINQSVRHLLLLRDRIEDTSSRVLVTGDLNAGKSTFCNALLRRKILPEDQQPCTSIFCEVLDAKENSNVEEAHAIRKDVTYNRNNERTYDVYSLQELEKIVTDNHTYAQCKVYVKDIRAIDQSLLNNGVVDISIIDAPGLNADSVKTTAVFARQEEIDVVVFVVSAANHFTLSAKEFIWQAAHEKAYIFMVVNGFDNIRDKQRCERMILEQVQTLSPRTFKESSELVHFVSSNAIPVAPAPGSGPGGDGGGGGGSDSSSGPSNDFPSPAGDDETLGKHGEPGSPPKKGKGKDKEKIQDFEELEGSLRRFVLEKRARSKLAPAKTYLLNVLADLNLLATVNRDIAQAELDRVSSELEEIEPAFEKSKKARVEVSDDVDKTIEETSSNIYDTTRTIINNAISQMASTDLGIEYPGLMSAFQYAEDIKAAMLDQVSSAVTICEDKARSNTISSVNTIKSLGILHLGDEYENLNFNSDRMFTRHRDHLAKQVDFDIEFTDFFDISSLWQQQEKVAGTGMALTVASVLGGRMMGGFNYVDGVLGAARVLGTQNMRRLIVPGLLFSVLFATTYALHSIPTSLPTNLSHRIRHTLALLDYTHTNSARISAETRKILRFPAESLREGLQNSVRELEEKREERWKVKRDSEVARKYFGNLVREAQEGRGKVEGVDLEGPAPGVAGGFEEGVLR